MQIAWNDRVVPASLVVRISRAWDNRAIAFHEEMPPLQTGKRRKKRRIGHNLALRLRTTMRFLTDPRTPFTNNVAERPEFIRLPLMQGARDQPAADSSTPSRGHQWARPTIKI